MIKKDSCPKFCRPRSLPVRMKHKVEKELERLVDINVLKPVKTAIHMVLR